MSDSFVVYLGGNLYLDSEGKLTTGPATLRDQVYEAAGGLKFDFIEAGKTLMELSAFLTDEKTHDKITKLHVSTVPMSILWAGAALIGTVSLVFSVAAFTVGVMLAMIEALEDKDEGISPKLEQYLIGIKEDLKLIDDRLTSDTILGVVAEFRKASGAFQTNLRDSLIQNLQGAARHAKHAELGAHLDALDDALNTLGVQDWQPLFRFEDYKQLFMLQGAAALNVCQPDRTYTPLDQRDVGRRFDYRIGLPILAYAARVYPMLVGTAVPWFRSSGSYAGRLRQLANTIDDFVTRMYGCFAVSRHTPDTLAYGEGVLPIWHKLATDSSDLMPALRRRLTLEDEYPVGAVDIVRYSDGWFQSELSEQYFGAGLDTGQRGAFDFSWPRDGRKYVAPEQAAADEANAESERVFGELMLTSGIAHLAQAAAGLRFLSTPPLASQTVSGLTRNARKFLSEGQATAKASRSFGKPAVSRPATFQRFDARAKATVETQPRGYPFAFNYRVRLVSVDQSMGDFGAWGDRIYNEEIWKGEYVKATGDARNQRLDVTIQRNGLIGDHLLYEGPSPVDPVVREGRLTLRASTFDWYVPEPDVAGEFDPNAPSSASISALKFRTGSLEGDAGGGTGGRTATGGSSIHLQRPNQVQYTRGGSHPLSWQVRTTPSFKGLTNDVEGVFADIEDADRNALQKAERRWVKDEDVTIEWKLIWHGQNLTLTVDGSPTDRPFQLLLVIEEDVYSGESLPEAAQNPAAVDALRTELHTVFELEIVNQLMLVPKEFFDAEKEALDAANKCLQDCNERFAISEDVAIRPPRGELHRKIAKRIGNSTSTAALAEKINRQLAHVMATSPDVFNDVVEASQLEDADLEYLARFR